MDSVKKYLEKISIYENDSLLSEYNPTQANCTKPELNIYDNVNINDLINTNKKFVPIRKPVRSLSKSHEIVIEMRNISLKLCKNNVNKEYILFFDQNSNESNTIYMVFKKSVALKKKKTTKHKYKKRKIPKCYKILTSFQNEISDMVKTKLLSLHKKKKKLFVNAVHITENKENPKIFVTKNIKTKRDINSFLNEITPEQKLSLPNITLENIQAFIVLNKYKTKLYLQHNDDLLHVKNLSDNQLIRFNNKKFVNAKLLNIKITSLKWYKNLSYSEIFSNKESNSSCFIINHYTEIEALDMFHHYQNNIKPNFVLKLPNECVLDDVIQDAYKLLVELQLSSIEQCNQLYLNYFTSRHIHISNKVIETLSESIKNNYSLLVKIQNFAIKKSIIVNKVLKKANQFLKELSKQSVKDNLSKTSIQLEPNIMEEVNKLAIDADVIPQYTSFSVTNVQDQKNVSSREIDVQVTFSHSEISQRTNISSDSLEKLSSVVSSTFTVMPKTYREIDVQTIAEETIMINKTTSPINLLIETNERCTKCSQTDISVNKNASIDLGGKCVQICKHLNLNKVGGAKLATVPEENTKDSEGNTDKQMYVEENPDKEKILNQIKNTLANVKDRFEKNSQIIKEMSNIKDNILVTSNIRSLMETTIQSPGDYPGKPKFLKIRSLEEKQHTALKVKDLSDDVKQSNSTTLSSGSARKRTKFKCEKNNLTLMPIKNFISSNRQKVSGNPIRLSSSQFSKSKKNHHLLPCIDTKHILNLNKKPKKIGKIHPKSASDQSSLSKQKPNRPVIQSERIQTVVPKIYRPVINRCNIPETPKLSKLTLTDVAPLQSEYPRKDNISPVDIEKTYLYKLINNAFSESCLEPMLKCSGKNCVSCARLSTRKKNDREKQKKEAKNPEKPVETPVFEAIPWNTNVKSMPDYPDFDFDQFMDDPNLQRPQTVTVWPVNVAFNKNTTGVNKIPSSNVDSAPPSANKKVLNQNGRVYTPLIKSPQTGKTTTPNKIQKNIQRAILKNQEKYHVLQQRSFQKSNPNSPKPVSNINKNSPGSNSPKVPTIITSTMKSNVNINNRPMNKPRPRTPTISFRSAQIQIRRQNALASRNDTFFDRKYKKSNISTTSMKEEPSKDKILHEISNSVEKSHQEMNRYIQQVEQKFLKTFSLPETEKVNAYNNLESEIKEMLHLLNNTKVKRESEVAIDQEDTNQESKQKLNDKESTAERKLSTGMKSVVVLQEPRDLSSGSELAVDDKKKTNENAQPSVCTDSINFIDSFNAIAAKQNQTGSTVQQIQPIKSTSILKTSKQDPSVITSFSEKLFSTSKKVRFKLDEKITRSETSLNMSTDDEEYTTLYEETTSDFSSEHEFSHTTIRSHLEISVFIDFKHFCYVEYPIYTAEKFDTVIVYEQVKVSMPENYDIENYFSSFNSLMHESEQNYRNIDYTPTECVYKCSSFADFLSDYGECSDDDSKIVIPGKPMPELKKTSPRILEFLDILTSISVERLGLKNSCYYRTNQFNLFSKHFPLKYYMINMFHQIKINNNNNFINLPTEINDIADKIPINTMQIMRIPKRNVWKHFSTPNFNNSKQPQILNSFNKQIENYQSEVKYLEMIKCNTRKFDKTCQTVVFNLQLNKKSRFCYKNSRRNMRRKCFNSIGRSRHLIKTIYLNDKQIIIEDSAYKKVLIFFYVILFSFAYFCMTHNYYCE